MAGNLPFGRELAGCLEADAADLCYGSPARMSVAPEIALRHVRYPAAVASPVHPSLDIRPEPRTYLQVHWMSSFWQKADDGYWAPSCRRKALGPSV